MGVDQEISSVRDDIAELKTLLETAKRPKVQSSLSVELRKFETKLVQLLELQKQESGDKITNGAPVKPVTTAAYDVPYKNYCQSTSGSESSGNLSTFFSLFLFQRGISRTNSSSST